MRNILFSLVLTAFGCLLFSGPAAADLPEDYAELEPHLDTALQSLNLTREDLGWNKWAGEGRLRPAPVQRSLEEPLWLFEYSEEWRSGLVPGWSAVEQILKPVSRLDDGESEQRLYEVPNIPEKPDLEDSSARESLERLAEFYAMVQRWDDGLDSETRSYIRHKTPLMWSSWDQLETLPDYQEPVTRKFIEQGGETDESGEGSLQDEFTEAAEKFDWVGAKSHSIEFIRALAAYRRSDDMNYQETRQALGAERAELPSDWSLTGEHFYAEMQLDEGADLDAMRVLLLGEDDNRVEINSRPGPELIIDFGGDDSYSGHFASGRPLGILIDWHGDDTYRADELFSGGSAVVGFAALLDENGSDDYRGTSYTLGSSVFGFSLLSDRSYSTAESRAPDRFQLAGEHGLGAATFGWSMLRSGERDEGTVQQGDSTKLRRQKSVSRSAASDTYRCYRFCQGFAGPMGVGVMADYGGNDLYYAGGHFLHYPLYQDRYQGLAQGFSIGWRDHGTAGGVGVLYDRAGNDHYVSDVYGQGAGYWYGLGMLIDDSGNDSYKAHHYAQGAGIHLASGLLLDRRGDDRYTCWGGPSKGAGHDLAVGVLADLKGRDVYSGSSLALGAGNANGLGVLTDFTGDDYYAGNPDYALGAGRGARNYNSVGLFFDLAGKDVYPHAAGKFAGASQQRDDALWHNGNTGAGIDLERSDEDN